MSQRAMILLVALSLGCVNLTPEQSCQAICDELAQCQLTIAGSSLAGGAACQSDCLGKITAQGASCKSSAAYLADCFQTYTCEGNGVGCSEQAGSFTSDCR